MTERPLVACIYCGGRHARAAEVRACWERSESAGATGAIPQVSENGIATPPVTAVVCLAGTTGAGRMEPVLGRSVVVRPGEPAPDAWAGCDRVPEDASTETLEEAWRERRPLVIDLAPDAAGWDGGGDEVELAPAWSLAPSFSFPAERRSHVLWANSVDARSGSPRWRWAEEAIRLGATPAAAAAAGDIVLPDGRPAVCDGGPLEWRQDVPGAAVLPRVALLAGALRAFGPNDTDADLAPDQLAAVTHAGGAARIIAPAGSGKTRVLTERARHLLRQWGLPANAVTLVAFNKRAATEMTERTADLPDLQVRTLNALGLALVNRSSRVSTIDEREVRAILGGLVSLPRRANTDPAAAWMEALSSVRLGLTDPRTVEAQYGGDVDGLPAVFDKYRATLRDRALVDFDEQIYRSIEMLLADPAARRAARATCRLMLVDEFQDLTPAHLLLIRLLAGPDGAVFGVGDDDQTIYGYSGASPRWLIDYRAYFPTAGEHPLKVNYRCPPAVVAGAGTLLTHNRQRVGKEIVARPGREDEANDLAVVAVEEPVGATVEVVERLVAGGAAPRQVAVLSRVNASLAPLQVALLHHGVPVRPAVDESYLSRGGVQAALAWLRLAVSASGRLRGADITLAARRPARGLSPKVVEWMGEQRDLGGLNRLAGRLSSRDSEKIVDFVADVQVVQAAASEASTAAALRAIRDGVGLDRAMQLLEGSRRRLDRSAQTDDLDALVSLAALHPEPRHFEEWLRESLRNPGDIDGVMLATIHSVKGREWPHVVVHDVTNDLLPHRLAEDLEEERRVFHVAITRGSSSVTIVAGSEPSPFIDELTEEWRPAATPTRPERRSRPAPDPSPPLDVQAKGSGSERAREALRSWRSQRAKSEGKPAFIYFNDETLDAMAAAMPATTAALARIRGIGPAKLDAYGDELLSLLDSIRAPDGGTEAPERGRPYT